MKIELNCDKSMRNQRWLALTELRLTVRRVLEQLTKLAFVELLASTATSLAQGETRPRIKVNCSRSIGNVSRPSGILS